MKENTGMNTTLIFLSLMTGMMCIFYGIQLIPRSDVIEDSYYEDTDSIQQQYLDSIKEIEEEIELEMNCGDTIIVKATMYNAVLAQCDDTPDKTADQSKIPNVDSCSHLNWIAVSQDLLWFNDGPIRYGDTVYVIAGHKTGYYIVRDAMNKKWTNRIDFLEATGIEVYRYNKAELIINS